MSSPHKLTPSETILPDDYPMHTGYVYIVDLRFARHVLDEMTVGAFKARTGAKEVRRCELFKHPDACIHDEVTP